MVVARVENTDKTRVNLIHRTVSQNAIVHLTGWEVHHIVAGTGTVVTGGRLMRSTGADGARVATIQDGESRTVVVGDVVIHSSGRAPLVFGDWGIGDLLGNPLRPRQRIRTMRR